MSSVTAENYRTQRKMKILFILQSVKLFRLYTILHALNKRLFRLISTCLKLWYYGTNTNLAFSLDDGSYSNFSSLRTHSFIRLQTQIHLIK